MTGGHERRIGRFCSTITDKEKNFSLGLDRDVTIEEDVWCGMNVTVLRGVTVGRGCTIAAGSVVTKSTPPYSICAGVPARFVKFYWTIDEILEHESKVYPYEERYKKDELECLFKKYIG